MKEISRRRFMIASGGVLAAPYVSRMAFAQSAPASIKVGTLGGVFDRAMEAFNNDFTARTGVKVELVVGNAVQWINQLVTSPDNPPLDVIPASAGVMLEAGRKGFFEQPTPEKVPNMADVPGFFIDIVEGHGIGVDYSSTGIGYHKERVPNPPKSIKEYIEGTVRGDWHASLIGVVNSAISQHIWNINDVLGGTVDDITPAIEAFKRMRANASFYNSYPDFFTQLETAESDIGIIPDGRAFSAIDGGSSWLGYLNPEEGGILGLLVAVKPQKAHPIAWEYINSMLAPGPQSEFSHIMGGYGMTNSKVVYTELSQQRVADWRTLRLPPFEKISQLLPQWVERWNREIGG